MTTTTTAPIRIYVASLSDYNAGRHLGRWIDIDADTTGDDVRLEIAEMLSKSTEELAEEWAVHDYEAPFRIDSEWPDLDELCRAAEAIEYHGAAFALAMDNFSTVDEAIQACKDNYSGEWDSLDDFAADYAESSGMLDSVPEQIINYFDFEAFGRDMELGGEIWTARDENNRLHVFWNL